MKKLLLAFITFIFSLSASAQMASSSSTSFFSVERAEAPVTLGIRGGVNLASMTASSDGYSATTKNYTGFNVGVSLDIPMLESLYLQSGLYYTMKGCKIEGEKYTPAYLEIPVMASYRYNFSSSAQLQINFGPYLAYGIAGKYKDEDGESYDFFDDSINKFDAGLGIGGGITLGKIYLGVNYEFGLTNMIKDGGDTSMKNNNLSINVGYNF